MTVIRIEHKDGIGIFRRDLFSPLRLANLELGDVAKRHQEFNTPYEDNLNMDKGGLDWYCAYKSIQQLKDWIKRNEINVLINSGYKILLLDVTNYQEGEHQVIFTKESIVSSKVVTELFL